MLVALEQVKVPAQLHDRSEFAVFLESLADRVSHGGVYGEHAGSIAGSAAEWYFSRRMRCTVVCSAQSRVDTVGNSAAEM